MFDARDGVAPVMFDARDGVAPVVDARDGVAPVVDARDGVAEQALHIVGDLLEAAKLGHLGGVDLGKLGDAFFHFGENLDALDGVDAEVGLELHLGLEHLTRVAGLLGDNLEHQLGQIDTRSRGLFGSLSRWGRRRSCRLCRSRPIGRNPIGPSLSLQLRLNLPFNLPFNRLFNPPFNLLLNRLFNPPFNRLLNLPFNPLLRTRRRLPRGHMAERIERVVHRLQKSAMRLGHHLLEGLMGLGGLALLLLISAHPRRTFVGGQRLGLLLRSLSLRRLLLRNLLLRSLLLRSIGSAAVRVILRRGSIGGLFGFVAHSLGGLGSLLWGRRGFIGLCRGGRLFWSDGVPAVDARDGVAPVSFGEDFLVIIGRIGLVVVCAVERDGEGRLFGIARVGDVFEAAPQRGEVESDADHR